MHMRQDILDKTYGQRCIFIIQNYKFIIAKPTMMIPSAPPGAPEWSSGVELRSGAPEWSSGVELRSGAPE